MKPIGNRAEWKAWNRRIHEAAEQALGEALRTNTCIPGCDPITATYTSALVAAADADPEPTFASSAE